MSTGYFAQVTDGVVTDVRVTTKEYMDENPDFYPGFWVEVLDMAQYPAVGYTWVSGNDFTPNDFTSPPAEPGDP